MELLTTCLVIIATFLIGIIVYYKKSTSNNYWSKKNIPNDKDNGFGTTVKGEKQIDAFGTKLRKQYEAAKAAGYKSFGFSRLGKPVYMPIDPEIIKNILSIDFQTFMNRGFYYNKRTDPIGAHLFALEGEEWRNLRIKLTPTFTSGKMKMMIRTVVECGEQLEKAIDRSATLNEPFNIRDFAGMFTTDVIGSCAFGLECNSFDNPNSDFIKYSKQAFRGSTRKMLKHMIISSFPGFAKLIGIYLTDKEVSNFFFKILKETVEHREKNNIDRHDFLQLLINLKNEPAENGKHALTFEEVAAQAFLFFIAGYETSSSTMSFVLYELSLNPDIQDEVRKEINNVLENHGGEVTYEGVMDMKYMEQTIDEALRKYPPSPVLFRQNAKDYKLSETNTILDKGTTIFIPSIGLHYDPEFFSDPEKFDPDRFSAKNKSKINPYTYLPFGEGPRNCIGIRFGMMQSKVGLTYLLKNYKFSLNDKTQTPIQLDPKMLMLSVLGGIWLNATKIE